MTHAMRLRSLRLASRIAAMRSSSVVIFVSFVVCSFMSFSSSSCGVDVLWCYLEAPEFLVHVLASFCIVVVVLITR